MKILLNIINFNLIRIFLISYSTSGCKSSINGARNTSVSFPNCCGPSFASVYKSSINCVRNTFVTFPDCCGPRINNDNIMNFFFIHNH